MRVQVNLSDEMVAKVDAYSKKMGLSRSGLCASLIGQSIMSFDKSMDLLQAIGDSVGNSLLADKALKEVADEIK